MESNKIINANFYIRNLDEFEFDLGFLFHECNNCGSHGARIVKCAVCKKKLCHKCQTHKMSQAHFDQIDQIG